MDERLRRRERRAHADPEDETAVEGLHRQRMRRGDHADYARELRRRVDGGDTGPTTTRHYIETLHRAHPEVAEHFSRWASHDESRSSNEQRHRETTKGLDMNVFNRRSIRGEHAFHRKAREHEREANSARDEGEREAKLAGHRAVFFLKPTSSSPPAKNEKEEHAQRQARTRHLSRMHDAISDSYQGSASYHHGGLGQARLSHHHDESASPNEARENAEIHAAVIKYHYPNARPEVRTEGPTDDPDNHDRHTVHLPDLHSLKPRSDGVA